MKKKLITLIICIVALLVLGGAYIIVSNSKQPGDTEEETESPAHTLTDRNKDELEKIHFKGVGYEMTLVNNGDGIWESKDYPDIELNQSALIAVVNTLASSSASSLVTDNDGNASEYGLSPAQVVITAYYSNGEQDTLNLGNMTPGKDYFYIMRQGDTNIYTISSYAGSLLSRTYGDFINTAFPAVDLMNIRYLYLNNNGKILEGSYKAAEDSDRITFGGSGIVMTRPINGKTVYLENFSEYILTPLALVSFSEIVEFDSSGDELYGLDNPKFELIMSGITVDEEGNENGQFMYQLKVGNNTDDTGQYSYASIYGLPCVFKVPNSSFDMIAMTNIYRMIDKFITIVYINDVDRILFKTDSREHVMEINGYRFYRNEEDTEGYDEIAPVIDGKEVDVEMFRDFYQVLVGMNIDTVIDDFVPSEPPVLTVIYELNTGEPDDITKYYEYDANFLAVEKNNEGICHFVISKQYVNKVFDNIDIVKASQPISQ